MTNLQAAVGCAQLERLDALIAAKRRIAARYRAEFADIGGLEAFPDADWAESAAWFSGVVLDRSAVSPEALIAGLAERCIGARRIWMPMHLQTPYARCPRGGLAVTEDVWDRAVTLPCSTGLSEAEQGHVIAAVHDIAA
jgi:dTDP-4-amino-4,6-dideoxygalactose transaminase